jgi:hypothetical protein
MADAHALEQRLYPLIGVVWQVLHAVLGVDLD